jgi:hypothetical protein
VDFCSQAAGRIRQTEKNSTTSMRIEPAFFPDNTKLSKQDYPV